MLFKAIILFAIGTATTAQTGWKVPKDQADGVYSVAYDETTNSYVHTFINDLLATAPAILSRIVHADLDKRGTPPADPRPVVTCRGYTLNAASTNTAFDAMASYCRDTRTVRPHKAVYSTSGDVVVFYCNDSDNQRNTCTASGASIAIQGDVSQTCGSFGAGIARYPGGPTYGQQSLTRNPSFC